MNEVVLHRGRSPHLSMVDVLVDGVHLTETFVSIMQPPLFLRFLMMNVILGRWVNRVNSNWINGLFSIGGGTYHPPSGKSTSLDAYLPKKLVIQTCCLT